MAETLGMLCDKLTIVKLKEYHTNDSNKLNSLKSQAKQLQDEINEYISEAIRGNIPIDKLQFESNKVYNKRGNEVSDIYGDIGNLVYKLAEINCSLWHEQEKVYEFEKVPVEQKDEVIKKLAVLNLQRNKCIDAINYEFVKQIQSSIIK